MTFDFDVFEVDLNMEMNFLHAASFIDIRVLCDSSERKLNRSRREIRLRHNNYCIDRSRLHAFGETCLLRLRPALHKSVGSAEWQELKH